MRFSTYYRHSVHGVANKNIEKTMRRKITHGLVCVPLVLVLFVTSVLFYASNNNGYETTEASVPGFSLPSFKHVTKSLVELGAMDEISAHILFFNRIPKSGSEMLALLIEWLEGWNNFRHVRLKSDKKKLTRLEQEQLVYNVYDIIKKEAVPLCFDQHVHFVNFTSFDRQSPTFINLIRDPIDSIIARLYSRNADEDTSEYKYEKSFTIDNCIQNKLKKCTFVDGKSYDLTISYFCGQDDRCMLLNNKWAFEQAKSNVEKYYPVVGVLEEVNATLEVFESRLPFFFKGIQKMYYRDLLQQFRSRNKNKPVISDKARSYFQEILIKEYEFYEWIRSRLFGQLQIIYGDHNQH